MFSALLRQAASSSARQLVQMPSASVQSLRYASTISMKDGVLNVPNDPVVPYIEGDGTGPDIWRATQRVVDAAVNKAYGGSKKIEWLEVLAGEKAFRQTNSWLPEETLDAFRKSGFRSLNVALRQELDLYVCLRPVRHFENVPSPVRHPESVDMVIFRENTEDIYAGIEFAAGSDGAKELFAFLESKGVSKNVRFSDPCGFGIKPISQPGSERLIRSSIEYALKHNRPSVTLVHKGNIMKFTEGAFRDYGYAVATREFRDQVVTERESWILGNLDRNPSISVEDNAKALEPGYDMMTDGQQAKLRDEVAAVIKSIGVSHGKQAWKKKLLIKDAIADITLQQVLTRPTEFSVIATMNLNGDYLSDALAAQVGGIGLAPGGNSNYITGHAIFEATHGTAPKYANQDKVNPGSLILSAVMMLEHMNWNKAADLILRGMEKSFAQKRVTYDLHRLMEGAQLLKCSEFGEAVVENME
eukprot:CAMPEP_0177664738 /NCGR_PEP_ID=MMETSP0447-20121125/20667_1 /TAXON_ID=0 /ORGANISM="Stygamoeba regulata, Strain BSH-02190019" /LENGTH=471 /DNA_ID=CAMNT_0019170757 /DNA_START=16 /DNA_END=1432 /DNA_ORIENTATION=+